MPIPTQDSNHVTEAIALLTEMFKKQPNITGLLSSFVEECQVLENQVFIYLTGILFANAVGDVLDKYGAIVLEPRNGRLDPEYKAAIVARFMILRSQGRDEDVISVVEQMLVGVLGVANMRYTEGYPAGFQVTAIDTISFAPSLLEAVRLTRSAGTEGITIFHTTGSPAPFIFAPSTSVVTSSTAGFADAQTPTTSPPGGLLASGQYT